MPVQIAAGFGREQRAGSLFGVNFRPAALLTLESSFVIAGADVLRSCMQLGKEPSGYK